MNNIQNNLIVELHVPDLEVAKDFYSKLGFRILLEDKLAQETPGYLTMARSDKAGETMLNFYGGDDRVYDQSFFKQFPKDTPRGYELEITIPTLDIDELYCLVKKELPNHIQREIKELNDHGCAWRDFRITDPFGFYLRFTEPVDWGQK